MAAYLRVGESRGELCDLTVAQGCATRKIALLVHTTFVRGVSNGGNRVDVRKVGIWMVAVGGAALSVGIVLDAIQQADDPTLASKEGIFDLSRFAHALFFGGMAVAVLGLFALLVGAHLYGGEGRVTVGRRIMQVGAPIAAVIVLGATAAAASNTALGEPNGDAAATEEVATAEADAAATDEMAEHAHGDEATAADATGETSEHAHGPVIEGTATGDSPCEVASPTPASPGQVGTGEGGSEEVIGEHGGRGMVKQTPLTADEMQALQEQMVQARTVIEKYPTVADAEAGGYHKSTVYVPCIGAHYTNIALVPGFDPTAPSELLYDGSTPDAKIVGLSYLVLEPSGEPPEGFAGKNDHWHQHNANGGLCFGAGQVVIGGEEMTEEECTEIGGTKRELTNIWMMHAWVVPGFECSWGVFAGECPELGGRTGGTAWDEPAPAS